MMSFKAWQKTKHTKKMIEGGGIVVAKCLPIFCFGLVLCEVKRLNSVLSRSFRGLHVSDLISCPGLQRGLMEVNTVFADAVVAPFPRRNRLLCFHYPPGERRHLPVLFPLRISCLPDLRRSFSKSTSQKKHRPLVTTVSRRPGSSFARSHAVDPGRVSVLMWTGHGRPASPCSHSQFPLPCCAVRPGFLTLKGSQAACLRPGVCGLCPWSPEPALMCSDELMPRDPRLENDSGPDAIKPWTSQVLMKAGILQITPKIYII